MLWIDLVRRGFRRHSTYRAAALAGVFTNVVFGCVRAYVLLEVLRQRPGLAGYDRADIATFTFLTQGLIMVMGGFGLNMDIPERIRTGDIALDLQRPVDFLGWWLALDLGRAGWYVLARGIAPVVIGALLFPFALPPSPGAVLTFVAAMCVGVVVAFGLRYLVCLACFWLLDERGVASLSTVVWTFLSGLYLPLPLFPAAIRGLALASPWAMTIQLTADAWLGRVSVERLLGGCAWAVGLLVLGRWLTTVARQRVVVQGG